MTDEERVTSILRELDVAFISYGNLHDDEEHGCKVIEQALKKQIPMKPKSKYDYRNCNVCPKCETEHACRVLFPWEKYCPDCGQAIDWSEVV